MESSPRIVVVDDDQDFAMLIETFLELDGYKNVTVLTAGEAAVELAKTSQVDLFIVDLNMPGLSGRELIEALMAIRPGQRIICASGFRSEDVKNQFAEEFAIPVLSKPFESTELISLIASLLERD